MLWRAIIIGPRRPYSIICKTAESMEMTFGVVGLVGPRNRVLGGSAQWRHLANMIERFLAAPTY